MSKVVDVDEVDELIGSDGWDFENATWATHWETQSNNDSNWCQTGNKLRSEVKGTNIEELEKKI